MRNIFSHVSVLAASRCSPKHESVAVGLEIWRFFAGLSFLDHNGANGFVGRALQQVLSLSRCLSHNSFPQVFVQRLVLAPVKNSPDLFEECRLNWCTHSTFVFMPLGPRVWVFSLKKRFVMEECAVLKINSFVSPK